MMTVHHARAIIHDELTERIRHQEKYTPERYQWYKDRLMNVYNRSYGNAMYMSRPACGSANPADPFRVRKYPWKI